MDTQVSFLEQLFDKGFLVKSGVDGLYGRGEAYEEVISGFDSLITRTVGEDKAEKISFPPGMSRVAFEKSGYMKSFPQLAGTVHSFCGVDHDHTELLAQLAEGENWTAKHKIHVMHEKDQLFYAVQQALNILKERRVDRLLKQGQEELKAITDEHELEQRMQRLKRLLDVKMALAQITGRVVVG